MNLIGIGVDKLDKSLAMIESLLPRGRAWIKSPGLEIYVRVTERMVGDARVQTLEIASVNASKRGKGTFSTWLIGFEALADKLNRAVYVENVLTEQFALFWQNRPNYIQLAGESPSFYRPPKEF